MLSWEDDPSISSMLGMLDKIDAALDRDNHKYWEALTAPNTDECPITFFYTSLQDLNLTDDLYIKMNARGLELTDFEKLKAAFNQRIDDNGWDNGKDIIDKFGHKMDNDWTDLFWQYRNDDNLIDNALINFIAGAAINCYAKNHEVELNKQDEDRIRKELEEKGKTKTVTGEAVKMQAIEEKITKLATESNSVCPDDFLSKKAYQYLVDCLNKYAEKDKSRTMTDVSLWAYCDKNKTLFNDLISGENVTQQKRVLFFAQTEYLLKNASFDQSAFDDWMRVIRNIVENAISGNWNVALMINLIRLIDGWSDNSHAIYTFLAHQGKYTGAAQNQINQEIEKAKLIAANQAVNRKVIYDTEDINFCKGDIDFALYCIDYDIDKAPGPDTFDAEKLEILRKTMEKYLDSDKEIEDDFKRAFLTIEKNNYYKIWWRPSHSFGCYKGWLCGKYGDLKGYFTARNAWLTGLLSRDYLKKLLVQLVHDDCSTICDNYSIPPGMPKWKEKLIKGQEKLDGATFILIPPNDNSYCLLALQQRPSRDDQVRKIV
jgi:hypothetical protein